ncbi:MAG: DUF4294 domain-containing protein [Firmicutes bacterium]|nr:DUF4294 domain-containing protein [Bacillota bacterium]MCM1401914.1 DUF4294 domain-containing protein [Bacteroides sp.]MCM1477828.1 DUF4294 domain-containing protein [Bacteroides sp.]
MKRLIALSISILSMVAMFAAEPELLDIPEPGSGRIRPVKGYYVTEMDGEEVTMIVLSDVVCYPPLVFKNKKEEEFYWRTVRDVKLTLPYAKLICSTLLETYEYIETFPTVKEREDYLKRMESAIFDQYKPVLKKFTKSQANMLCKLIKRETNQSGYNIIKAFLGSFRAGFWQTFGRFFGVNLKTDYKPDEEHKDAIIERVASSVELGLL